MKFRERRSPRATASLRGEDVGHPGRAIAPNTVIQSAEYLPEGSTVGTAKVSIPFCRVIGVATPTADSHIGFEVWLPPASGWNGPGNEDAEARCARPAG